MVSWQDEELSIPDLRYIQLVRQLYKVQNWYYLLLQNSKHGFYIDKAPRQSENQLRGKFLPNSKIRNYQDTNWKFIISKINLDVDNLLVVNNLQLLLLCAHTNPSHVNYRIKEQSMHPLWFLSLYSLKHYLAEGMFPFFLDAIYVRKLAYCVHFMED